MHMRKNPNLHGCCQALMHGPKTGRKVGAKLAQEGGTPLKTTGYEEVSASGSPLKTKCSVHQSKGMCSEVCRISKYTHW